MVTPKNPVKLFLVTRTVVAGPPGCPATDKAYESEESMKRLEHKPRTTR